MTVTFKDVAKLAGVSTQTVSRVTNGSENVAESTRIKVNQAIKQLGYVPNKGAQMLSRAKSTNIGLITLDMALHGAALIANGVRIKANQMKFGTALSVVSKPGLTSVLNSMRELIAQQVDCIILNVPLTSEEAISLVEQFPSLYLIFIDVPETTPVHSVHCDHASGASQTIRHLIEGGRHQFLLVTGPEESTAAKIRLENWLDEISAADKKVNFQYRGDWQAGSGYLAVRQAVGMQIEFDAIVVANDQMALGVLRALDELQISVPEQVAVVGFDGINDSAYFNPPLTTVKQDFTAIGEQAVIQSIEIKNRGLCQSHEMIRVRIPVELIVRRSSEFKQSIHNHSNEIRQLLKRIASLLAN
ncbi:substrate-binding domain-containing protein [Vibrio fluvialis]|nr:substrate-binding domain-containing protein [Vibrio fluvialis]HDV0904397.1 substrate-binding domain-containing protein [Vibrio fluvialis]